MTLDIVRGIAILMVLLFHFQIPTGVAPVDAALVPFVRVGWAGVDLFFVLSGFLVGRGILSDAASPGGFDRRRFFVRRALRLGPALYLYLAALWLAGGWEGWRSVWLVLLHVQNYTDWAPSHLWSLAVEEHFYLLGALLLPVLRRKGIGHVVIALATIVMICPILRIGAISAGVPMVQIQWQSQYRLDALALGVLLACCSLYRPIWLERAGRHRAILFAAAASGFTCLAIGGAGAFRYGIGFSIVALASAALIVAMLEAKIPAAAMVPARALAWLGTISYSLYVWHASLGRVAQALGPAIGLVDPLPILVFKLTLTIGASALLYYLVEQPATRLRDVRMRLGPERNNQGLRLTST